jgi:hypothetical protein
MSSEKFSRREFLKQSSAAVAAGTLYLNFPTAVFGKKEGKTRVVLIRHKKLLDDLNRPNPDILQEMLDEAVTTLLDESDVKSAWKKIISPKDIVGIKSNVWHYLPTTTAMENAIKKRVLEAGVSDKNISIGDRGILNDPIFLKATALKNSRPMRTHYWSGVGSLIKNYIMFVRSPSDYHPDSCADLAKLWFLPLTKGKTRLNILVMFSPLFHGIGPHHFNPKYIWRYQGIIVGIDPVAVDVVGLRILTAKRKLFFKEDRPLSPPPKHIFLADTRHHLGTADLEKIELIKLGWTEDTLI